jgi:hypothetical protein
MDSAADARERIKILQPLSVVLPPTGLPAGKTVLEIGSVGAPVDWSLPMTGNWEEKNPLHGVSANKRLVPMPRQLNKYLLNPVSVLFTWPPLIQKSGFLAYTIVRIGE